MLTINISINEHNWPRLDIIIARGNAVQHITPHYDRAEAEIKEAVGNAINNAVKELNERHNPVRSM